MCSLIGNVSQLMSDIGHRPLVYICFMIQVGEEYISLIWLMEIIFADNSYSVPL